jgi:chemotaxis protein MotB
MARKKPSAHHGGAWKVAYADFVTAMMALFMVLWICSQDKEILIATSRYFQSPFKSPLDAKSGLLQFDSNKPANSTGSSDKSGGSAAASTDAKSIDLQYLNSVAKDVFRMLNLDESLSDKPVDVQVTSDGLRITLFDRASKPFFEGNGTQFTAWGDFVLQSMAWLIDRNGFNVVIEGHTRRGLDLGRDDYNGWDLSADRANAARRALTHPLPLTPPEDDTNQRITLSLRVGVHPSSPVAPAPARPAPTATPSSIP